ALTAAGSMLVQLAAGFRRLPSTGLATTLPVAVSTISTEYWATSPATFRNAAVRSRRSSVNVTLFASAPPAPSYVNAGLCQIASTFDASPAFVTAPDFVSRNPSDAPSAPPDGW